MFVPDELRTNAYRVLRLSANATLSEIHRAGASMRRAATLGVVGTTETDIPLLGVVPRTEADIRTAMGRLGNPPLRLSDRLFWFHEPRPAENTGAQPLAAMAIAAPQERAALRHDMALRGLFTAFEAGLEDSGVAAWVRALRAWHQMVSDDDYWALALTLEERGAFEPTALPSDFNTVRDDAVRLGAEALVVAGRDAVARNNTPIVRRILVALEELADTGSWPAVAEEDIASPVIERFRELCRAVREQFGSKIVREPDAAEPNKSVCDAALKRFRDEIRPALEKLLQLLPQDHEAAQQSREEAARCLGGIAIDYTWADDFITSEGLHEEALTLAQGTLGTIRIEHGLAQVRESAREQRVFGALKPISSPPTLRTVNGFGFMLYGNSDHDPETQSYVTTYYFAALFIPVFPITRYRVVSAEGKRYRFLGELPLRRGDRLHIWISLAVMIALICAIGISSNRNTWTYDTSSASAPDATNPGSHENSPATQLSDLNTRIEAGRSQISTLKSQLRPVIDELNTLKVRLEALASEIKSLDGQHRAGIQIDIADYNARVDTYNGLIKRRRALLAANSSNIQLYNELIKQDKALVAQYNALVR